MEESCKIRQSVHLLEFPLEVLSKMYNYCDNLTLKKLIEAIPLWKNPIEHVIYKRFIATFPKEKLRTLEDKWLGTQPIGEAERHEIFNNWYKWSDVSKPITFKNEPCPGMSYDYVLYITTFMNYIAIACYSGMLYVHHHSGELLFEYGSSELESSDEDIMSIEFLKLQDSSPSILLAYEETFHVLDVVSHKAHVTHEYTDILKAQKNMYCWLENDCLHVAKIVCAMGKHEETIILNEDISAIRNKLIFDCSLLDDKCMIVVEGGVYIIEFHRSTGRFIEFCEFPSETRLYRCLRIQDSMILVLYTNFELLTTCVDVYQVLDENVACVRSTSARLSALANTWRLHGDMLVLGLADGKLMVYLIDQWEHFDWQLRTEIDLCDSLPIRTIDVAETEGMRVLYVGSDSGVHKILCS